MVSAIFATKYWRYLINERHLQVSELEIPFLRIEYAIAQQLLAAWKVPIKVSDERWTAFSTSDLYKRVQKRKLEATDEEDEVSAKRKKLGNDENCVTVTNPSPPAEGQRPLVLFSGLPDTEPLKKMVLQLGGQIAKNSREATHLVLPKFARTIKVMCAVNNVKHICSPQWVYESQKANTFLGKLSTAISILTNEHRHTQLQIDSIPRLPYSDDSLMRPQTRPTSGWKIPMQNSTSASVFGTSFCRDNATHRHR